MFSFTRAETSITSILLSNLTHIRAEKNGLKSRPSNSRSIKLEHAPLRKNKRMRARWNEFNFQSKSNNSDSVKSESLFSNSYAGPCAHNRP